VAAEATKESARRRRKEPPVTDREKILIALREKPWKAFEIMRRVNIKNQDDCQSLLLKMRDDGAGEVRYSQRTLARCVNRRNKSRHAT
jgi:hypothetical protein